MAWRLLATVALASFGLLALPLPAAALPPVEAFGSLPDYSRPALSPDGKHLAAVRSFKGRGAVTISRPDAPEGAAPVVVDVPGGAISSIRWANSDRLIIIVRVNKRMIGSGRLYTWWRAFSVDTDGKNLAVMLDNAPLSSNSEGATIADVDLDDPDTIYMPLIGGGVFNTQPALHLYRVNVNTGKSEIAVPGTMWTGGWVMDGHGHVAARIDTYSRELRYHIMTPTTPGADYREIGAFDLTAGGAVRVGGVAEDGQGLIMEMPSPSRTIGIFRIDLSSLAVKALYTNPNYDVRVLTDEWNGRIVGASYVSDKTEYVYFNPARQKLQAALERAFPGQDVAMQSCDVARRSCIVVTDGPRKPATYYFFDVTTMRATHMGSAYPQLTEADLGEMRPYPYAARDGLPIPAYLTLPPGREAKSLPLVVMPHGGPGERDEIAFYWWAQFLANRGYAVLQPNFRGSHGYGSAFLAAGNRQWGLAMQDDLADGVAKLVADGIADPRRVCIAGLSYGGYAALAGAAFAPDTYACAVSVAGISQIADMLHYVEQVEGSNSGTIALWQARVGDPNNSADAAYMAQVSPALHADAIKMPVLLMHCENDTTVPMAQSVLMRDALEHANKRVQFVALEGDDHNLDLAQTRIRMLGEVEKFLAANIGR